LRKSLDPVTQPADSVGKSLDGETKSFERPTKLEDSSTQWVDSARRLVCRPAQPASLLDICGRQMETCGPPPSTADGLK
jgi:hypothetical protein